MSVTVKITSIGEDHNCHTCEYTSDDVKPNLLKYKDEVGDYTFTFLEHVTVDDLEVVNLYAIFPPNIDKESVLTESCSLDDLLYVKSIFSEWAMWVSKCCKGDDVTIRIENDLESVIDLIVDSTV